MTVSTQVNALDGRGSAMQELCCKRLGRAHADTMYPISLATGAAKLLLRNKASTGIAPIEFCPFCGQAMGEVETASRSADQENHNEELVSLRRCVDILSVMDVFGEPDGIVEFDDNWTQYAYKHTCGRRRLFVFIHQGRCFAFARSRD